MPKTREPSHELLQYLSRYDPEVVDLMLDVRQFLLKLAPTASEIDYDAKYTVACHFTFTGKFGDAFCYCAIYTNHVNIGFLRGAKLTDPNGLLRGDGKQMRNLQITNKKDLKQQHVHEFVLAAIEQFSDTRGGKIENAPTTVAKASASNNQAKAGHRNANDRPIKR